MPPVVVAPRPSSADGPNGNRRVAPLTIPNSVRSLGVPLPPAAVTLQRQLHINQQRYELLDAYYRGSHGHAFDSQRFSQAFGEQLRHFADNWLRLVVSATANRLTVQGFRIGEADEDGLTDIDYRAWGIWQANSLAQGSMIAHRDAMKFGTSFVMVDPLTDPGNPKITVESPYQVIGQRDAADRYGLVTAIKKWIGNDGFQYLNYYEPAFVLKFKAAAPTSSAIPNDPARILQEPSWYQVDELANPLGKVPIVPMENQPDLMVGGMSDLDDLIPLNDGLNKVLRDMLVASEYQGFRQRWATGVEVPKDPETGQPITSRQAQLEASQSNVWMFASPGVKVGDFAQVDLTPYTEAIDALIHHISMVSMVPSYLLVGKIANLSADAIRASELGFVGKLWSKQADFGGSWQRAMGFALGAETDGPVETIWKDAAANSGSVLANELAIMGKLGVPQEALLEKYGYSPITIERWKKQGLLQPMNADEATQVPELSAGAPDS